MKRKGEGENRIMKRGNEKKSRKIMFWTDIFLLSIKMDKTCGILIVGNH